MARLHVVRHLSSSSFFTWVYFIIVLHAVFMCADIKSPRRQSSNQCLFALLGSAHVKAACKTMMKSSPVHVSFNPFEDWFLLLNIHTSKTFRFVQHVPFLFFRDTFFSISLPTFQFLSFSSIFISQMISCLNSNLPQWALSLETVYCREKVSQLLSFFRPSLF